MGQGKHQAAPSPAELGRAISEGVTLPLVSLSMVSASEKLGSQTPRFMRLIWVRLQPALDAISSSEIDASAMYSMSFMRQIVHILHNFVNAYLCIRCSANDLPLVA